MTSTIPAPLSDLAAQISKLPGMGPKSAMRVVMTLLRWPEEQTRRLGASISSLRDQLHICRRCGGLSTTDVCPICQDATRSQDILCLVTDWDSMMTMDRGGFYRGQYLILGGLLSPLDNRDSDKLDLKRLEDRLCGGPGKGTGAGPRRHTRSRQHGHLHQRARQETLSGRQSQPPRAGHSPWRRGQAYGRRDAQTVA